jgi:superfamily II DNA or RNA helicase
MRDVEKDWVFDTQLREWQENALASWISNDMRGVASVVTGGGKTILAFACMNEIYKTKPNTTFIIVVPTIALLDQWAVELCTILKIAQDSLAIYGGGKIPSQDKLINLMVINTARKEAPRISDEKPCMLIIDECHRAASAANAKCLDGMHIASIGLSATPQREWDYLFEEVVQPRIGNVIFEYGYNEAKRDGVISPFNLINVKAKMTDKEQNEFSKITKRIAMLWKKKSNGDDVDAQLQRLLRRRARCSLMVHARLPLTIRLVEQNRGAKTIIFHEDIHSANIICNTLLKRNHRAALYHSGMGMSLRQDNLRMFRGGQVDVLVTCRALDEGISVPDASIAIIAASTTSTRQRIQRLGRVLRPSIGKETATVYTIYASPPEEERLKKEAIKLVGADSVRWFSEVEQCHE